MTNLQALSYAHENQERFLDELKALVAIPSISTDPLAAADMQQAAVWVADRLRAAGIDRVEIFPTAKHPIVYGEHLQAGAAKPTVLIYGHYDVQPAEPLDEWGSPPFEPTQRGENLFGRGASDMKGQVIASIAAVEALLRSGELGVNIKFLIEGEEEIGSPNLGNFIIENRALLACDVALNPDSGMLGAEIPTITYGLRGLAYFEINLQGPKQDLHSGLFGGAVHNPAQVLCELIAGMHDEQGHITLPGYYDSVIPIDDQERAELARLPQEESFYLQQSGAPALYGEAGYSPVEQVGARPTLEVNGLLSGFTGEGSKTVLPAHAMAKISMRLVPNQDPKQVHQQLRAYMESNAPDTVTWDVQSLVGGSASISDRESAGVVAMTQALEETWGIRPVFKREGGSIPVVADMQTHLGVESVLTGFGLPDDNLHGPNEKLHLPTFYRGIQALVRFFSKLVE